MDTEVLLVNDLNDKYQICGITYSNAPKSSDLITVKASKLALDATKYYLQNNKKVVFSKLHPFPEVVPSDLVVVEDSDIESARRLALNDINNRMQQNIFDVCIIDAMDYLNCYMKLLAAGIFITDSNREDKYFEIIESAQTNEKPNELPENATFEQEQEYLEKLKLYNQSQENLSTLETYLNAYDKLARINFMHKILNNAKNDVMNATTIGEIHKSIVSYLDKVDSYFNPKT